MRNRQQSTPAEASATAPPAADRLRIQAHVEQRLIRDVLDNATATLVMGILIAVLVAFTLWRASGQAAMGYWLAVLVGISVIRLALIPHFKRRLGPRDAHRTGALYALSALAGGVSWAMIVAFDGADLDLGSRLMILITIVGMPVASLASNAIHRPVYLAFAAPIFMALFYWTWRHAPSHSVEFTVMAATYTGLVLLMAERYNASLQRSLLRDIENERLLYELNTVNDELHRMAYKDPLTGLANRRGFEETTSALLQRLRPGDAMVLMLIDMDDFKRINDSFGHAAGDAVLVELSRRIEDNSRLTEMVAQTAMGAARIGGDEFIVVYRFAADSPVEPLAKRILDALTRPMTFDSQNFHPGVSIGIAVAPTHATDLDGLLRAADRAMYQAKHAGGGRFVIAEAVATDADSADSRDAPV